MAQQISPQALQNLVDDKQEFALFDIRRHEDFIKGHLWLSINVPSEIIGSRIGRYVPRLDTRILLIDQNQSFVNGAVENLESTGYSNLYFLSGGINSWQQSGMPTITGDYVLAHAFGLYVDHILKTPPISAASLMQKLEAREDVLIVDSRDLDDYRSSTLPGAINVPIAEMVSRIPDLVSDESTQIVVHCGGVTRGILGAQTLIDAKLANPVMWLLEGTTGWCLGGGELSRGEIKPGKPASTTALAYAEKTARDMAEQEDLVYIEPAAIEDWIRENPQRTCYLIDVRGHEEFLAGHYANSIHIPGGELVGMTQDHIATYNSRLCLIGDARTARAEITASWMVKNGWKDIVILRNWERASETGNLGGTDAVNDTTSTLTGKPEPEAINILQASIDTRQHIFKCFMRELPRQFELNKSKPPRG